MSRRLSWHELRRLFPREWVELVDCEWEWSDAHPRWAVVRHHDRDRNALLEKIKSSGAVKGALILNVGISTRVIEHHYNAAVL